ncbi:MAG: GNAT family N-acetyltransferase [Anaerolineae bacterium]|nr:GNAT family N-acetyltransferase [Anaerolineae bacterium]
MAVAYVDVPETLVITHLHMTSPDQFQPAFVSTPHGVEILECEAPDIDFYRFLYSSVGYHLRWRDRLLMPDAELNVILRSPKTSIHVLYVHGTPAGYVELEEQPRATEIAYFGLRPQYQGRGLGKHLLSYGIAQAWEAGAQRVWVHTCNMDGQHALSNYTKRGFSVFRVDEQPMPDRYRS